MKLLALVGRITLNREPVDVVLDDRPPENMNTTEDVIAIRVAW